METPFEEYFDPSLLGVLPNETLVNICQQMDVPTLYRFVQTYGRVYQLCNKILTSRQQQYLVHRNRQKVAQTVIEGYPVMYTRDTSMVTLSYSDGNITITQYPPNVPWPFPYIQIKESISGVRRAVVPTSIDLAVGTLIQIIGTLEEHGYIFYLYIIVELMS